MRQIMIQDASGRSVPLIGPPTRHEWPKDSVLDTDRDAAAAKQPWATERRVAEKSESANSIALCAIGMTTYSLGSWIFPGGVLGQSKFVTYLLWLMVAWFLAWLVHKRIQTSQRRRYSNAITCAYLAALWCPSCGETLPADAADPRPCAGCGCRWSAGEHVQTLRSFEDEVRKSAMPTQEPVLVGGGLSIWVLAQLGLVLILFNFLPPFAAFIGVMGQVLLNAWLIAPWTRPWRRARQAREAVRYGLCGGCGYDREGLEGEGPCPECGLVPLPPEAPRYRPPPPKPVGSPRCARCGGDMTGREERICPDCGAMYGIDYV